MESDISDIVTRMINIKKFYTRKLVEKYMEISKMQHLEVIPQKYWGKQRFDKNKEKSLICCHKYKGH